MNKRSLRNNTRRKAMLGADGAIMAAAALASAGINAAATASAAKKQAESIKNQAEIQKQAMLDQNTNNNNLQKESIDFTRSQNEENRQQQQAIQTTLQLLAGQQNMNDIMEANKAQVKNGGRPKRTKLKSTPFYRGASRPFRVTDGGQMIPIAVYPDGNVLYEAYGNDHEHYHKAQGGKNKTGVGLVFNDGSELEVEGNQNTNQGEYLLTNSDGSDAMAISKHSIKGFNPAKAVNAGMNPIEAFAYQEQLKDIYGITDDGNKAKCGGRKSMKKLYGGYNLLLNNANLTQNTANDVAAIATGSAYASSPVERYSMKCGGRKKADWGDWAGATYSGIGNLAAAGIGAWGNMYSAKKLGEAYSDAAGILTEGYKGLKGIDISSLKESDYTPAHAMAVVRGANTNINPQLERIRRNSAAETRNINKGTMSSAARQQRLAATNDRMRQSMAEQYSYKNNIDEQIKHQNAQTITQTAQFNAQQDNQARQNFSKDYLDLLKYNNDIENSKVMGIANAQSGATMNAAQANASALQNTMQGIGQALVSTGQGFGSAASYVQQRNDTYKLAASTSTTANAKASIMLAAGNNLGFSQSEIENVYKGITDENTKKAFAEKFNLTPPS